jgi:GDP-4-dehydro-6-deoxy-D-mannose reductase
MQHCHVLITGVCGFTGRHLAARLRRDPAVEIFGLDIARAPAAAVDHYCCCDLTDSDAVCRAVRAARPNMVFHLAGLFGAAPAEEIERVNVGGFTCLCDALRQAACDSGRVIRGVTVGSAAEIGSAAAVTLPITEEVWCEPDSAYGRSKLAMTRRALAEPANSPLRFVVARPFNLVGPGLSPQLSLGNFARQIVAVTRGQSDAVHCGPLDARRDYVDVRDAVEAYVALAERGRAGQIYNVCTGRSHRIGDLLGKLVALAARPMRVVVDSARERPGDLPEIYGDHSKITRELGWRPSVPIEQSLNDLLADASAAAGNTESITSSSHRLQKAG